MHQQTGKLFGVGLGPGDPELITVKALRVLRDSDVIFTVTSSQSSRSISASIVSAYPEIDAEIRSLEFSMRNNARRSELIRENATEICECLKDGKNCSFTTIGDPLTYSTFGYILHELEVLLPGLEVEVIPGVNSWSALAAKKRMVLAEDLEPLTIIPSYASDNPAGTDLPGTKVYLKTYRTRNKLLESLEQQPGTVLYGANLGLENEVLSTSVDEIRELDNQYLSMLIVKDET